MRCHMVGAPFVVCYCTFAAAAASTSQCNGRGRVGSVAPAAHRDGGTRARAAASRPCPPLNQKGDVPGGVDQRSEVTRQAAHPTYCGTTSAPARAAPPCRERARRCARCRPCRGRSGRRPGGRAELSLHLLFVGQRRLPRIVFAADAVDVTRGSGPVEQRLAAMR